jgi:hypothetical protein
MFSETFQVSIDQRGENTMSTIQQHICYVCLLSLFLLIWLHSGVVAYGQSSTNYQIERSVLDAGGGQRNSSNYRTCDSVGQPSGTTISISSNYIHTPGYYECDTQSDPGPDPSPTPPAAIPEPGTLSLFGSGVLGLLILTRRKLNKKT